MNQFLKKRAYFVLLIAFAVCSCHVKGGGEFAPEGKVFTATATVNDFVLDGASKTAFTINDNKVSFAFEDDDILRIYPLNPVGDGLRFTVKDNKGTSCVFDGGGFGLYNGKSYAAFYPGSDESVPNATEIPVDYTGQAMISKEAWDLSSVDYLVANVPALQGSCSFSMQHVGALLVLDVTFEEAGIYNELSLTSQGNPFIATGTIDLTADPIAITGTEFADTISLALGGSDGISVEAGETVRFIMMIAPVDMSNSTILMELKNGNDMISAEIEGKNYEAGKAYKIDAGGTDTNKIEGSRRDVIVQSDFGGSGASGDDVSEGSGPSQGNEDSSKNGINYVYGNNTVAVTDAVMEKISNLTKDGFRLPADSWGNSSIGHGDVFVFPQSELFPGGYAAKVTDITPDGDGFYYSTTLATIDEIFETLHLEQTAMDLTPYIEKIVDEDGTEVDWAKTKAGFSLSIPEIFGGINGLAFDLNDNVQISPSAEINFNLDVAADIVGHRLAYARANVNTSARLSADVSIKDGPEKKWQSKRFKVIVAPIPVWPVIITPEVYVSFELKLTGEVNMTFSVNYQKAYYAYTIYDGSGVHSDAGEASVPDKEDPFAVTEELSGGVEFGPNVGVGLSLYGGALGVSVDFNPHAACAFAGSLPFTMETWTNIGSAGMWLSNAYYEPSVLFSFGGAVDIAYIWHVEFELPDNVQLSYSFGKTFIIPKLGETLDIKDSQISTTIYNKAIFDDDIFVYIRKDGPDGPILYKNPFTLSRKPKFEGDEVNITTSVSGLDPGTYYVDGPYITISAFGYSRDIAMTPVQDDNRYIEVKGIDLGLPSGLRWATCNVGANAPAGFGDYFAWGETKPYYSRQDPLTWKAGKLAGYDWPSYKWCNGSNDTQTKYCTNSSYGIVDNKTVLDIEDDAASVNWGGTWRIPTDEEWTELSTECTWTWTTQNRVNGMLVTGPNGNSIFLPAAGGFGFDSAFADTGILGYYWSSSLRTDNPSRACLGFFDSDRVYRGSSYPRFGGFSVRPVSE